MGTPLMPKGSIPSAIEASCAMLASEAAVATLGFEALPLEPVATALLPVGLVPWNTEQEIFGV